MHWHLCAVFLVTVLFNAHELKGKLISEHSPKSSEMLSNAIYSSKNNEITEVELNVDKEAQAEIVNEIEIEKEPTSILLENQELQVVNKNYAKKNENEKHTEKENIKIIKNALRTLNLKEPQLIKKYEKGNGKFVKSTTNGEISKSRATVTMKTPTVITSSKSQLSNSFINPFGQLSAFFSGDQLQHLQDYNFLFNAERHTIFRLHTTLTNGSNNMTMNSGRVLNTVVSSSLSAAFGATTTRTGNPPSKIEEVQLYNAASLRQSRFNPFNPTRILIHGWFGGSQAGVYNTLVPEYLKLGNGSYNVFTVDWGRGAVADYITASYRVKPVGKVVAKFVDFLHREAGMRFEELHVIGFSMGAHVAGIAGKHLQTGRLPIIYALDPALPLFRYENIDERVALTDADYVEVIHTCVGSYGYDHPLGHVDFYVNYGSGQPGCFFNECSHFRAFQVLAESLHSPDAFRGQGCDVKLWSDLIKNRRCLMGTGRNLTMGGDPADIVALRKRGGGVYYFTTNASPPYAKS